MQYRNVKQAVLNRECMPLISVQGGPEFQCFHRSPNMPILHSSEWRTTVTYQTQYSLMIYMNYISGLLN